MAGNAVSLFVTSETFVFVFLLFIFMLFSAHAGTFKTIESLLLTILGILVHLRNRNEHWLSRPYSVVIVKRYFPEMCIIRLVVDIED